MISPGKVGRGSIDGPLSVFCSSPSHYSLLLRQYNSVVVFRPFSAPPPPLLVPTTMVTIAAAVSARTLMTLLARRSSWIANTAARALSVSFQAPALPNSSLYKRGAATLVAQPVRLPFKNHVSSLSARHFSGNISIIHPFGVLTYVMSMKVSFFPPRSSSCFSTD